MQVEFFYEFASTYSYPAALCIEAAAAARGVEVLWRPFLLGPVFEKQGYPDSPFNLYPVKGRYMWRDLERVCADLQIPFRRPSVFPRRSVNAARVALLGTEEGWGAAFSKRVYHANFVEDRDIDDEALLTSLLDDLGLPGAELHARANDPARRPLLRAQTERALSLGIFGAPTFVVSGELFWGHDRMQQALAWAIRSAASA